MSTRPIGLVFNIHKLERCTFIEGYIELDSYFVSYEKLCMVNSVCKIKKSLRQCNHLVFVSEAFYKSKTIDAKTRAFSKNNITTDISTF